MAATATSQKVLAAALSRLERLQKIDAFDPYNLDSKPTIPQQQVLDDFGRIRFQWIVAGNQSGKSQTCSRLISWVVTDTHPTWKRPAEWSDEPLLVIVAGRTGKQIEESLLPKLESYLNPGTYKVVRIGNIAQRLELDNGNRIVFQSLENPTVARERLQSYVAHVVWVDEMPPTVGIINELQLRVQARNGYFLASFTPLVVNDDIRKIVDNASLPLSKKYKLSMLDNPIYSDPERRSQIIQSMENLPESVRKTRFEGDWSSSENSVYYFNWASMVEFPEGYSTMWRHVESVDPALKSALGLTVWAENPNTGVWYCIIADYIKGIYVPTELVKVVKERTKNFNIVRRISDPHEVWYIQTAHSMGITYMGIYKKNDRKAQLIKKLQECLGDTIRIAPNCEHLIAEFQECRWSESDRDKIVNSSSYHLLDSAQYFCDEMPKKEEGKIRSTSWEDWLYQSNEKRKVKIETDIRRVEKMMIRRRGAWHR